MYPVTSVLTGTNQKNCETFTGTDIKICFASDHLLFQVG